MKWTFFAGLGAGAAIGMLVAPKRGAELREEIQDFARDTYEQGRERLEPVIEQARQKVQPVVDQAREKIEPAVDLARQHIEPVMEDISQSVDRIMAQAADVRDRVEDTASDLTKRVTNGGLMSILNEWPRERLIEIDGIGPVLATKIIQHRPYESEEALLNSKELPPSAIESLRKAA
ncbi:MAG: YtxH domain-containing protein [Terriglobales bacterium]